MWGCVEDSRASLTPTCAAPWVLRSPCSPLCRCWRPGTPVALVCWQGDWHLVPTGAEGLPSSLGRKSTGHSTLQTAAPSPRAPPKVAPCPPICASALALREPRQPLTGSERVPEHRAAPTQGTARGPLAPNQEDMSTQSRQELPSQKCQQQGRAHPTSERQASGTGRRRLPWQRAGPGSPGCRPRPPPTPGPPELTRARP